jgi:hypothetical protein
MSDDAIAVAQEEQHLGVPIVAGKRPAMAEDDRLARPQSLKKISVPSVVVIVPMRCRLSIGRAVDSENVPTGSLNPSQPPRGRLPCQLIGLHTATATPAALSTVEHHTCSSIVAL